MFSAVKISKLKTLTPIWVLALMVYSFSIHPLIDAQTQNGTETEERVVIEEECIVTTNNDVKLSKKKQSDRDSFNNNYIDFADFEKTSEGYILTEHQKLFILYQKLRLDVSKPPTTDANLLCSKLTFLNYEKSKKIIQHSYTYCYNGHFILCRNDGFSHSIT